MPNHDAVKIQLKHICTDEKDNNIILFEHESIENTVKKTLEKAAEKKFRDLSNLCLKEAYLKKANLRWLNFSHSFFDGVYLKEADLRNTTFLETEMNDVDLRKANLTKADMRYIKLRHADMNQANLSYADLRGASLFGTNLDEADFTFCRTTGAQFLQTSLRNPYKAPYDFMQESTKELLVIFNCFKKKLPSLKKKIINGNINGRYKQGYYSKENTCYSLLEILFGKTQEKIDKAIMKIDKYSNNYSFPYSGSRAAALFYQILEGDTPNNNEYAYHALKLIDKILKR